MASGFGAVPAYSDIRTARLHLDRLVPEHAPALYRLLSHPALYEHMSGAPPHSEMELAADYARRALNAEKGTSPLWLSWRASRSAGGDPIGIFEGAIYPGGRSRLAYIVFPNDWRNGYGREGCAAVVEFLSDTYDVSIFECVVSPLNDRSIRMLRALGFSKVEALPDNSTIPDGADLLFRMHSQPACRLRE